MEKNSGSTASRRATRSSATKLVGDARVAVSNKRRRRAAAKSDAPRDEVETHGDERKVPVVPEVAPPVSPLVSALTDALERQILDYLTLVDRMAYADASWRSRRAVDRYLARTTEIDLALAPGHECTVEYRRARYIAARCCASLRCVTIGHSMQRRCAHCRPYELRRQLLRLIRANCASLTVVRFGETAAATDDDDADADDIPSAMYRSPALALEIAITCPRLERPFYVDEIGLGFARTHAGDADLDGVLDRDDSEYASADDRHAAIVGHSQLLLAQLSTHARYIREIWLREPEAHEKVRSAMTASRDSIGAYLRENPQLEVLHLWGDVALLPFLGPADADEPPLSLSASTSSSSSSLSLSSSTTLPYLPSSPSAHPSPLTTAPTVHAAPGRSLSTPRRFSPTTATSSSNLVRLTLDFRRARSATETAAITGATSPYVAACRELARLTPALERLEVLAVTFDACVGGGAVVDALNESDRQARRELGNDVTHRLVWRLPRAWRIDVDIACGFDGAYDLPRLDAPRLRIVCARGFSFDSVGPILGVAPRLEIFECTRTRRVYYPPLALPSRSRAIGAIDVRIHSAPWWDAAIATSSARMRVFALNAGCGGTPGASGRSRGAVSVTSARLRAMTSRWPRLEVLVLRPARTRLRADDLLHVVQSCPQLRWCDFSGQPRPGTTTADRFLARRHALYRRVCTESLSLSSSSSSSACSQQLDVTATVTKSSEARGDEKRRGGGGGDGDAVTCDQKSSSHGDDVAAAADTPTIMSGVVAERLTDLLYGDLEPEVWRRLRCPRLRYSVANGEANHDISPMLAAAPILTGVYAMFRAARPGTSPGTCSPPPPDWVPPAMSPKNRRRDYHVEVDRTGATCLPQIAAWMPHLTCLALPYDTPPFYVGVLATLLRRLPRLAIVDMSQALRYGDAPEERQAVGPIGTASYLDLAAAAVAHGSALRTFYLSPLYAQAARERLVRAIRTAVPACPISWHV